MFTLGTGHVLVAVSNTWFFGILGDMTEDTLESSWVAALSCKGIQEEMGEAVLNHRGYVEGYSMRVLRLRLYVAEGCGRRDVGLRFYAVWVMMLGFQISAA